MIGAHTIRTYSSTQTTISLSSGEAEYYGFVKGAAAGLGHQAIMSDFGINMGVRLWTDSSAALGISKRSGLGRIRHLDTHTLWLQEKVRTGAVEVRKINGEENPADLFTKHLPSQAKVYQLVRLFGCEYRGGRAAAAPLLRPAGSSGQVNTIDDARILPHLKSTEYIEAHHPIIVAPPSPSDNEVVSQAELWVIRD